ncbi:3-phosphoinositide-dependent protein kinase 1 isoform X2 [Cimex lectularius]|uniref:3-phosphoinositide-dependent protein kinase 1 n=1 Tax=Cimex lectularius TaxID=79782 RepID=A0A8I6TL65_CIMLE|nr:3-phosphoinositide-dependent protein kinase 1 isoform X2 [Cimex lectularius]
MHFEDVSSEDGSRKSKRREMPTPQPRVSTLPLVGVNNPVDSAKCNGTAQVVVPPSGGGINSVPSKRSTKDFRFGKVVGEGSFATVYLTKDIHTNKEYAIKVCDKRHIIRERKTEYVQRERDVLNIISTAGVPFFVKLYCTFQDTDSLYFVLSYAKNGELLPFINKVGAFDTACTRFYAAEILLALEHLHRLKVIHRDLKPENILLDENMHILITDFGSAKIVNTPSETATDSSQGAGRQRRNSFVGTAQYVSPELLTDKTAHYASDLWALGCVIYQMISGLPPFRGRSEYTIFQKIQKLEYEFPEGFDEDAKDLVQKLLVQDPNERLGAHDDVQTEGYVSVRNHKFFEGVDFKNILLQTPPKISPYFHVPDSNYNVPDHIEPGLNSQLSRLLGLGDAEEVSSPSAAQSGDVTRTSSGNRRQGVSAIMRDPQLKKAKLLEQAATSRYHQLVEGRLILKQGIVNKRKGLFSRRRMLLLTEGPRLFYVDPATMVLKGEIPYSSSISTEPKNFKTFFVHTPNRTYYLEEPEGYALDWCKAIDEMKVFVID